jgi:antitoxin component of RelBE/YafQ-DinJ toxin-antitoxin module
MTTTTKTIGSRVNSEVHTLFTDVCNKEGVTMSQKINQLVTDCVSFPSKTKNKVESNLLLSGNIDEDRKLLDSMTREDLEKSLRPLDSKPRKTLDEKIRILDSTNRKDNKIELEFNQSKDEVGKFMKSLMNDSRKNNYNYNQDLVKLAFSPYLKDLKQSIADLNTRFDTKIDEDKMKKGMECFTERSCFDN